MAFSNLFAPLPGVSEDVKSSCHPAFKHMNEADTVLRGRGRKRKNQSQQSGKRQYFSNQRAGISTAKEGVKAEDHHRHMTKNEYKMTGFKRQVEKNHPDESNVNNTGQDGQSSNQRHANKQYEQKKMKKMQRNLHQQTKGSKAHWQTRQSGRRGGRGGPRDNTMTEFPQKRFMTQEFKEQNALEVDGRLLCQHFLWGRCIKGDLCQLEHVQGYNGLIKEVCKFYMQGFCLKGDSCPFMHKSFPCKFFHKHGECNREYCKFSHEPLTDVTGKLLDEAIKRSNDLIELAKKAEQESAGRSENPRGSAITETDTTADMFREPVRPHFYGSSDVNTEKEDGHSEDLVLPTKDDSPPHGGDDHQPHNSPPEEPVCYSVEAVLGPQRFQPFRGLATTPSSDLSSGSLNQSEAPYSVSAVLRSLKSGSGESCSLSCQPPLGQTVLSTLKTEPKDVPDPLPCSGQKYEPVHCQEITYKGLSPNMCPGLAVGSADVGQCGDVSESQRATSDVNSQMHVAASAEIKGAVKQGPVREGSSSCNQRKYKSLPSIDASATADGNAEALPSSCFTQTSTPKPHLSVSCSSIKPFCPSPIFRKSKGRDVVSTKTTGAENYLGPLLTSNQPTEIHQSLNHGVQRHRPELKRRNGRFSKSLTTPFRSRFETPIAGALQPGPREIHQSGLRAPAQPEHDRDENHSGNTSTTSFASLFATPLGESAASRPHLQSQSRFSAGSSCFQEANQQSDLKLRSPVGPLPDRTTARISHGSCSEISERQSPQTQMHFSSHKEAALGSSVLRSLFVRLSPYPQDEPHQGSAPSECEKTGESDTGCV